MALVRLGPVAACLAFLVIGYGGADALLEKIEGRWRLIRVEHTWVT